MCVHVLPQAFAEEQSAMLADLPSVEDGNFTQTQAGQAPSAALEAMETDEGETPAPHMAALITLPEAAHSSVLMLVSAVRVDAQACAWHACQWNHTHVSVSA